ncbi:hypothetical protein GCM10022276_02500 [Sphingomonas limnosediminicola]|uniref:Uncharacterized protein n=1 Tax=Sphingomonas limnosediminicola TaxID=940133 RepID=A0ABP7KSF4_9SPHN
MFEGWSEFYLMAGGAAAVLIGLIFVVISLMQDRSRSSVLAGSRLYMGPIVLGVSFVLALSAAALTPSIDPDEFAAIAGLVALWGLVRALMSVVGIARLKDDVHWTDVWFYGVIPVLLYLALGVVALAFWDEWPWAHDGLAAVVTALLLLAIRNEWDLITWIAPRSDNPNEFGAR